MFLVIAYEVGRVCMQAYILAASGFADLVGGLHLIIRMRTHGSRSMSSVLLYDWVPKHHASVTMVSRARTTKHPKIASSSRAASNSS